ncbi:MAG: hypothetical protein LC721_01580 [Actinobacteria bacterium]|nr:hypothetical protein [Actinomycetota bacterium]
MRTSDPDQTPPDAAPATGPGRDAILTELLTLSGEFFQQASPTVRDELHRYLTDRGLNPHTCLGWFLDALAFTSTRPHD